MSLPAPQPSAHRKIALVTGGGRGLGRNVALHLARAGHDVILTYRQNKAEGEAAVAESEAAVAEAESLGARAALMQLDVADPARSEAFAAAVSETLNARRQRPQFDSLVDNAGINRPARFAETAERDVDELVNVHFKGVFFPTRRRLPLIADGGRIVNTSSGLARFTYPGYAAYAAMKGAVEVLTRYLAKELGPRRIGVNVVAPGIIETDFTKGALAHDGARDVTASNIALGRVGVPDDIGGVVAFLCSDAGRWVNGQRLEASGGMFL